MTSDFCLLQLCVTSPPDERVAEALSKSADRSESSYPNILKARQLILKRRHWETAAVTLLPHIHLLLIYIFHVACPDVSVNVVGMCTFLECGVVFDRASHCRWSCFKSCKILLVLTK